MTYGILLLAAGASSRMRGRDKLLEEIKGVPLLRLMAERALAQCENIFVTLPSHAPERRKALEGLAVQIIEVPDAASGMSASLRAGSIAAADCEGLMVLPADMPEITSQDMGTVITCFEENQGCQIIRGSSADGRPGHPVMFPVQYLPDLARLTGDQGARSMLKEHPPVLCPLPGNHALTDLDTPEEWQEWRRKTL